MAWPVLVIGIFVFGIAAVLVWKISNSVNRQIISMRQQIDQRLGQTASLLQQAHQTVGDRLDSATKVFGEVQKSLGRLEETQKHVYAIGKDISSLQDLLRAPKFRGEVGETLLVRLLEEILPKENVHIQHRFKDGSTVDAAIVIGSNIIPIDAKFPLENFRRLSDAALDEEKKPYQRALARDVKARIDEVALKYIVPEEGTFDFALMYIPAEAVYYYISRDEELNAYAKIRKVVFVSPSTFYAYLQAILHGLRGVAIQKNVRKIFGALSGLQVEFKKFLEEFATVGTHLYNAGTKYQEAQKRAEKFSQKLIAAGDLKEMEFKNE